MLIKKTITKTSLLLFLLGTSPSYAQTKQVNAPQEKPFYTTETFVSTVLGGIVIAFVGYVGGLVIGGTKTVSQAEKDKFKRDFLKEEIIPLIDTKIATNEKISEPDKQAFEARILKKVAMIVDTKIATNEKIKGLELQNILLGIQNSIDNLAVEIQNNFANQEREKESVIRRFDEVHKQLVNQQGNSDKLVERVNQTLQSTIGEYMSVPIVQVRGRRDSLPANYDKRDGGNIG